MFTDSGEIPFLTPRNSWFRLWPVRWELQEMSKSTNFSANATFSVLGLMTIIVPHYMRNLFQRSVCCHFTWPLIITGKDISLKLLTLGGKKINGVSIGTLFQRKWYYINQSLNLSNFSMISPYYMSCSHWCSLFCSQFIRQVYVWSRRVDVPPSHPPPPSRHHAAT